MRPPHRAGERRAGIFHMLNDMIAAKNTGDMELYGSLRRRYEKDRFAAKKLFTLQ